MPSCASSARAFIAITAFVRRRLGPRQLELAVERLLADADRQRAGTAIASTSAATSSSRSAGDDAVDQPPVERGVRRRSAGRSTASRAPLAADRAGQRDHRGRAEQPDLHARGGEARVLGGHRQVARGDQLAARRGRDAMTWAITGCGSWWIGCISSVQTANSRW